MVLSCRRVNRYMKVLCNAQNAYKWYHNENIYFRGYFFLDETLYYGENAIDRLSNTSPDEVIKVLPDFNGIFSLIIDFGSKVLLACDRLRGLPSFYSVSDDDIVISDLAKSVIKEMSTVRVNPSAYDDYSSSSLFVSGYETLVKNVFQVQAAEYVLIHTQSREIERHDYYHYKANISENSSKDQLKIAFFDNYQRIGQHLAAALRGRTAVVPLSGGADSRMVVSMLKEQKIEKVICYTYGIKGNSESKMSKAVADYYGYPWYMVEYDAKMWDDLQKSDILREYDDYATNYVSTPHIQDILAIIYLKEHHIIPQDAVFVPGHSGDMIAGSHLTEDFLLKDMDYNHFIARILTKHYPKGHSKELENKIKLMFPCRADTDTETYSREYEWFNIRERQAKFIVNSVRAYEFIGHEWLIPLWDNSQFDYWSAVPVELRYDRKLYFECVHDGIKSTNDKTKAADLAEVIRKTPLVNDVVRRLYRILKYYTSKIGFEHMFSFKEYMTACLTLYPTFTINDMLCDRRLRKIRKELNIKDEEIVRQ